MAKASELAREALNQLNALLAETKPPKRSIKVDIIVEAEPAPDCFERMREAYAILKAAYTGIGGSGEIHQCLRVAEQNYKSLTQAKLVDLIYAARHVRDLAEDMRKKFSAFVADLEKTCCERDAADSMSRGGSIQGEFASGSPAYKKRISIPDFEDDPERYNRFCDWLGVPEDLRDKGKILYAGELGEVETEIVKLSYKGIQDMINCYLAAGHVLPDFVMSEQNKTWDEATVRITKKDDLL